MGCEWLFLGAALLLVFVFKFDAEFVYEFAFTLICVVDLPELLEIVLVLVDVLVFGCVGATGVKGAKIDSEAEVDANADC